MAIVDIKKVFFATSLLIGSTAFAQKYEVKDIRIEGLEQINPGAVFTTLGLDPDATVQTGNVKDLVERLYSTGLFKDVTVKTENGRILGRTRPKSITVQVARPKQGSAIRQGGAFGNIRTEAQEPEIEYVYEEIPCTPEDPRCQPRETIVRSDLVIELAEFPVLSKVTFNGNKDLKDKQLTEIIAAANLRPGETLRGSSVETAKNNMLKAYETRGKYAIIIEPRIVELPRNRAEIQFDISEGRTGQIQKINFTGNNAVSDGKLLRQMRVRESSLKTIFSSGDRYDPYTIQDELDKVQEYYRDNGYLKAEVNYSSATISPSQDTIYLDIDINEGQKYTFGDFTIVGNYPSVDQEELLSLVTIEEGNTYRAKTVDESVKAIQDRLGNEGYALARVNAIPKINETDAVVGYAFAIDQGERVYVNRINIEGNERTRDEVFRRELRQMEGGRFVASDIERSRVRIQRLAHVEDVNVSTNQVEPGVVDLTYNVKERSAGSITFGLSYGMDSKFGINAGFNQPNFMGTGHELNVQAETNKSGSYYGIDYMNPYMTKDGLSAGVSLSYSKQKHDYDDTGNYIADGISLMFNFGYPVSEYTSIRAGIGYENLNLKTTYSSPAEVVKEISGISCGNGVYCADGTPLYKSKRHLYRMNVGVYRDTRNRTIFASDGSLNSATLSGTLPGSTDKFYKVHLKHQSYYELGETDDYVLSVRGDIMAGWGYGNTKGLPFYENFYAGGLGTVRGFRGSSIGPKYKGTDDAKGGAMRYNATAEMIMKVPGFTDNNDVRWSIFFDAGNVTAKPKKPEFGDVRYSAGMSFVWLSPLGPLAFSYAKPFHSKDDDREQKFQFSIGIPY
ncbi:outer membrane protein assembly factor BamA [Ignatzschineria sp. LJL83]